MNAGTAVLLGALVIALVAGLVWKLTYGRMRTVRVPAAGAGRPGAVVDGSTGTGADGTAEDATAARLSAADLGQDLGERATLVQFSSAFCAPCRATRRVLAEVTEMTGGVTHVEIDAESRLDLVRRLGVLRTPTVLVLAGDGSVVRRASGQPRKADVIAAIGAAVNPPFTPANRTNADSDSGSARA